MQRFELREHHGVALIQLPLLTGILHAFGTKTGGEEKTLAALDLAPGQLLTMRQVHSAEVLIWRGEDSPGTLPHTPVGDAVITNREGVAVGVWTADCIPILLADPVRGVVAAVHAGWRGMWRKIVQRAVQTMQEAFGSVQEDIRAGIGPGIASCCYEVREDVVSLFQRDHDDCHAIIHEREGKSYLDLPAAARLQLAHMGIPSENIADVTLCTACRKDLFFSYRRDGSTGRHLSFIMMR